MGKTNTAAHACAPGIIFMIAKPSHATPFRSPREPEHLVKHPDYPDPNYYLNPTSKYFFRARALQHLRTVKSGNN